MTYDVVIVGGGPGGSTTASLLKKYRPELKVLIVEREQFPREHIGESQLPVIGSVLHEMGVWDKVEAANFIIKFGASYTWGNTREPWIFGFIPDEEVKEEPRPQPYGGWRAKVALQVDRAIYDKILLDHAQSLGCEVLQGTSVSRVLSEGDRVLGLELSNGATVKGRYYVDASGNAAVLRRALNVKVDAPTLLQNVALWDYFEKPGMNKPILERGSIRIRIRSVPFGWVWSAPPHTSRAAARPRRLSSTKPSPSPPTFNPCFRAPAAPTKCAAPTTGLTWQSAPAARTGSCAANPSALRTRFSQRG